MDGRSGTSFLLSPLRLRAHQYNRSTSTRRVSLYQLFETVRVETLCFGDFFFRTSAPSIA